MHKYTRTHSVLYVIFDCSNAFLLFLVFLWLQYTMYLHTFLHQHNKEPKE